MLAKGREALAQFLIGAYGEQGWLADAAEAYLRYGKMAFSHAVNAPAKNSEAFVGRRYSILKRALGNEKMNCLMIMVANDPKRESFKTSSKPE
jgi:hypothetical protein